MSIFTSGSSPLSRARGRVGVRVRAIALQSGWVDEVLRRVGTLCPPYLGATIHLLPQRHGGQRLPTLQKSGSWIRRKTP